MHLLRWLIFAGLGLWSAPTFAQTLQHLMITAQAGDGTFRLLDTYKLRNNCNLDYFLKINELRSNQGLREGKTYLLPIFVYTYNGKSIRSTTGNNDLPWAEKVQAYNEYMHKIGVKAADYRDDKVLWVPYHYYYCPDQIVAPDPLSAPVQPADQPPQQAAVDQPSTDRGLPLRGTYPIFGEKYAAVPLESTQLSGKVYYIVAGHGGPDPGAIGNYGTHSLCEDEYAYDVALRLARNLLAFGATVYVIIRDGDDGIREGEVLACDKDETCWTDQEIPINQSLRLTQRSEAVNQLYQKNKAQGVTYQRLIVIHIDSNSQKAQIDMFFYYQDKYPESKAFAQAIHRTIDAKYDEYRKGRGYTGTVSARDLHMLRETDPVAVFIELGNIRNRNDQARFVVEGNRQLVANWLFEGVIEDAQ
ncbi:MAG: hypothetical protein OHK0039_26330 [Bacteroidia bacterium]